MGDDDDDDVLCSFSHESCCTSNSRLRSYHARELLSGASPPAGTLSFHHSTTHWRFIVVMNSNGVCDDASSPQSLCAGFRKPRGLPELTCPAIH